MASRITFTESNHQYRLQGHRYPIPSVSALVKSRYPFDNPQWQMTQAADAIAEKFMDIAALPPSMLRSELRAAGMAGMTRAAEFGRAVHSYAERLWKGTELEIPGEYAPWIESLIKWWDNHQPQAVAWERVVYSDARGPACAYAGTFDLLVDLDGELGLIDLKTRTPYGGGQPRPEQWAMQLAAYAGAEWMQDLDADSPMPDVQWLGVLHVGDDTADLIRITERQWNVGADLVEAARELRGIK